MSDRLTREELDRLPFIRCPDCGHRIHVDVVKIRDEARDEFLDDFVAEDAALRILERERERVRDLLVEAWDRDSHAVRFNKAGDDLTPHGRVRKWLRTVEL